MQPAEAVDNPTKLQVPGVDVTIRTLAPTYSVESARWSPDGKRVLIYGRRRADPTKSDDLLGFAVVDIATGAVHTLREHARAGLVRGLLFGWLPDSQHVWINRNSWENRSESLDAMVVTDLKGTDSRVSTARFDNQTWLVVSHDARRFASVLKGKVQIARMPRPDRALASQVDVLPLDYPDRSAVTGLRMTPGDHLIVQITDYASTSGGRPASTVYRWNVRFPRNPPAVLLEPQNSQGVNITKAISPSGNLLAYRPDGMPGTVVVQRVSDMQQTARFELPPSANVLAWSPDDRYLLTVAVMSPGALTALHILDVVSGKRQKIDLPLTPGADLQLLRDLAWSSKGNWLAGMLLVNSLGGSGIGPTPPLLEDHSRVVLVNRRTGERTKLPLTAEKVVWSPTAPQLVLTGGPLRLVSLGALRP